MGGFVPPGSQAVETVLIIGGYGGDPELTEPSRQLQLERAIKSRNDVWCGNWALGKFANWTRLAPGAPFTPRSQSAAVVSPTLGSFALLLFGGFDRSARLTADLWRWSGENATA